MKRKNNRSFLVIPIFIISFFFANFLNQAFAINTALSSSINRMISNNQNSSQKLSGNQLVSTGTQNDKSNLNTINHRFSFILFYLHSCPHCQRFDPILRNFSENNKIPVLAYTLDGQSLPSFPNSVNPTKAEVMKFFPTQNPVVPTLFLMDQDTHQIYPVLQGEATEMQLSQRYSQVTQKINEINNGNDGIKNFTETQKQQAPQSQEFHYE